MPMDHKFHTAQPFMTLQLTSCKFFFTSEAL